MWKEIFEKTMQPAEPAITLYQRTPLEIAANLATEFHSHGIFNRMQSIFAPMGIESSESQQPVVPVSYMTEQLKAQSAVYEERCKMFQDALNSLADSESYRIGFALTLLPRKIFNLFRGKKKETPEELQENEKNK